MCHGVGVTGAAECCRDVACGARRGERERGPVHRFKFALLLRLGSCSCALALALALVHTGHSPQVYVV